MKIHHSELCLFSLQFVSFLQHGVHGYSVTEEKRGCVENHVMIISIFSSLRYGSLTQRCLLESSSIVCQIHIENRDSECLVWPNLRKWMAKALVEISWIWFGSLITDSGKKLGGPQSRFSCQSIFIGPESNHCIVRPCQQASNALETWLMGLSV